MASQQCKKLITLRMYPLQKLPESLLKRKPPLVKILIFEPIPPINPLCIDPVFNPPGSAMGVTIKVCKYSHLCQSCNPPPLCDCKPAKTQSKAQLRMKKWCTIIKICTFIVTTKWLFDIGVFKDARHAKDVYNCVRNEVAKLFTTTRGCISSDALKYDRARITYNLKNVWNMFVGSIVNSMTSIPRSVAGFAAALMPGPLHKPGDKKKAPPKKDEPSKKPPTPKKKAEPPKKPPPAKKKAEPPKKPPPAKKKAEPPKKPPPAKKKAEPPKKPPPAKKKPEQLRQKTEKPKKPPPKKVEPEKKPPPPKKAVPVPVPVPPPKPPPKEKPKGPIICDDY